MKLRIKGNSVRFRLSKTEVERFAKEGMLHETTNFGNNVFRYTLQGIEENTMSAELTHAGITLLVPSKKLLQWAGSNSQVGISEKMGIGNNETLSLLLEKDFKCIDANPEEDQADFFENPDKVC